MANKFIVVTGGTKGIGRAILEKFLEHGFDALTCSRTPADLDLLSRQTKEKFPHSTLHTRALDLSRKEGVHDFVREVLALGNPVDVLVNNAGYFVPSRLIDEPEDTLEQMISSNLFSAYYATKGLVKSMIQRQSGHIFNICSIASIAAYPNGGSYAISKAGLLSFSRGLREELKGTGIRVTAVLPGATFTDSWGGSGLPETRFMKPEDVAQTVYAAYTVSPQSVLEEIILRPQEGDI